jgi:hypothetical protein
VDVEQSLTVGLPTDGTLRRFGTRRVVDDIWLGGVGIAATGLLWGALPCSVGSARGRVFGRERSADRSGTTANPDA